MLDTKDGFDCFLLLLFCRTVLLNALNYYFSLCIYVFANELIMLPSLYTKTEKETSCIL